MRVVPCVFSLTLLCVSFVGCTTTNKKNVSNERAPFIPGAPEPVQKSPGITDPLAGSPSLSGEADGLLAGQVKDGHTDRPTAAYIRWVCLDEVKEEAAPIDVTVGTDGYFIIQGLKRGKHYKLIARTKHGDRSLAGVVYTRSPNPKVLIRMTEEFATPQTPAVGGAANVPGTKNGEAPANKTSTLPMDQPAWMQNPAWQQKPANRPVEHFDGGARTPAIRLNQPIAVGGSELPQQPKQPNWQRSPQLNTPQQDPPPDLRRIATGPGHVKAPLLSVPSPTPVPSCLLIDPQLHNFALRDLNGEPWEYRKHRRGKLVLLDFWSTTCQPCVKATADLRLLQERYGSAGLEIVAVAYEQTGSPAEQAKRVAAACQKLQVHYQVLLGSGKDCPVLKQFGVHYLPTLVLIGENGWIHWRHEGGLDPLKREDLELRIKRWLGA